MDTTGNATRKTSELIRRFAPYFKKYKWVLVLDPVSYTHLDVYKRQPTSTTVSSGWKRRLAAL